MTNQDDDIDVTDEAAAPIDAEVTEDFEAAPDGKMSLREMWESNPLVKVAAIVLGVAVLFGGYFTLVGGKDAEENKSVVDRGSTETVKTTPGTDGTVDIAYREALEEQNRQRVEEAIDTGTSAIPTPINKGSDQSLELTKQPTEQEDPLKEWRARIEAKRKAQDAAIAPDESAALQPDVIPMVQPVRPQQTATQDPAVAQALAEQMRVIMAAQVPSESKKIPVTVEYSPYIEKKHEEELTKNKQAAIKSGQIASVAEASSANGYVTPAGDEVMNDGSAIAKAKVIVPSGSIAYGQLLNELNSDIPGPAMVQILSGPFAGGRALGKFDLKDEYLVITFERVIKDGVSYSVNSIALDEKTTLSGHQTDVDHHYFMRVILPAAAKFVEGYGSAVAETGQSTTETAGGAVGESKPDPNTRQELLKGVEEGASELSQILDQEKQKPITVKVVKGTTMGILFIDSVTTGSVEE